MGDRCLSKLHPAPGSVGSKTVRDSGMVAPFDGCASGAAGVEDRERGSLYADEVELDLSLRGPTGIRRFT